MIVLRQVQDERTFVARLAGKAAKLAAARAESRVSAPDRRWRSARLLWPLLGER